MEILTFIGLFIVAGAIGGLASSLNGIRKSLVRIAEILEQTNEESTSKEGK
jgi:hypothetical protein